MTLFLQNDTMQKYPAGFEKARLNFFDPAEDIQRSYEKLERQEEEENETKDEYSDEFQSEKKRRRLKRKHDLDSTTQLFEEVLCSDRKSKDLRDDSDESDNDNDDESSHCSRIGASNSSSPSLEIEAESDSNENSVCLAGGKGLQCAICIRPNCKKPSRFDSSFCSDACGVATVELDLLRTFEYSTEMHPYILRN